MFMHIGAAGLAKVKNLTSQASFANASNAANRQKIFDDWAKLRPLHS